MCIASTASKTTDEHFDKARALLNDARYAEAAEEFKAIVKLEPDGSEIAQNARYWVGQCYFRIEQFDEALAIFEKLIVDYPKSAIVPVTKLMIGQVQQEKENAKRRTKSNTDNGVIIDPKTGVKYTRTTSLVGKSDIIKYTSTGFSLSPDGRFLLWEARVIPLDGSQPFNLVDMPASRGYWSPDMKQIAFCSGSSTWVIPVSPETGRPTGPAKKLLDYHAQVTWSPDSEKIAFLYGAMIRAISIKDGSQSQIVHDTLTSHADWRYHLTWSHNGKTLTYSAYSDGRWNIWLCSTDGGAAIKTIETNGSSNLTPFFSPDDNWILYQTHEKLHFFHIADKREFSIPLPKGIGTFLGPSPDGKKMLFYQPSYDFKWTLKVASSSGGPSLELGRQLTLWGVHHFWSPDSKIIVADGETKEGEPAFWVIPLAGGDPFPLEMKVSVPSLTGQVGGKVFPRGLSPDCSKLLFYTEQGENTDLWVVPVSLKDGKTNGKAVNVFSGWKGYSVFGERIWSPDGKEIVLIHKGDVWIAYADGKKPVQRTNNPDIEFFPSWSPDGKMIAYDRQGSLWVIPASGGEARKPPGFQGGWAWSPDNRELTVADGKSISVVSISDGKTREIRDLKDLEFVSVEEMCWSPDGKHLALIADYNAEYDPEKSNKPGRIFVFPADGGKITQIASDDDSVFKFSLSWSPDGKWVSYNTEEDVKTRPESIILETDMDELLKKCQVKDWAGKWQPSTSRYCYAKFRDATTDAIRSDGRGQYADYNILDSNLPNGRGDNPLKGEDRIEVFFQGNDFLKLFLYVGRMQWYYNPAPASSRRAEFHFNIGQPAHKFDDYQDNKAVFDILKKYKDGDSYVDRDLNNPRSIHIPIIIYKNDVDGNDLVQFTVDPNPLSPPKPPPQIDAAGTDPRAITQTKVDDFYPDDTNIDYWDTGQNGWENNQIVYVLDYGPQGFNVETLKDSKGNPVTWVFTTNNVEPVKLYVYKYQDGTVYLAQYDAVPFQFAVSVNSLADFSFSNP